MKHVRESALEITPKFWETSPTSWSRLPTISPPQHLRYYELEQNKHQNRCASAFDVFGCCIVIFQPLSCFRQESIPGTSQQSPTYTCWSLDTLPSQVCTRSKRASARFHNATASSKYYFYLSFYHSNNLFFYHQHPTNKPSRTAVSCLRTPRLTPSSVSSLDPVAVSLLLSSLTIGNSTPPPQW